MNNTLSQFTFAEKINLSIIILFCVIFGFISFSFVDYNSMTTDTIVYAVFVAFILCVIGILGTIDVLKENNEKTKLKLTSLWVMLSFVLITVMCFSSYISGDYDFFLSNWVDNYKNLTIQECLYQIVEISNYTPAYNYFLIIIAKLGVNSLLAIKFITFLFSILLAVSMELIVSLVKKSKFNYLRMVIFLIVPTILMEYTSWGQCDAIYTAFCVLAFYFALKRKSKLSFLFVGLAFAFKLQFLFIVPILFVMLINKDKDGNHYLKWKDIWIAPIMYVINLIPMFAGMSIVDLLLVYFRQTISSDRLSLDCANLCHIYSLFDVGAQYSIYPFILWFHIILSITLVLLLVIFIIWLSKRKKLEQCDLLFFATVFSFIMVLFMPKMLDRFYFIASVLGICLAFVKPNKSNIYIALLIELALFLTMYCTYHFTEQWINYVGMLLISISLIMNIGAFIIMIKIIYNYKKNISKNIIEVK